MKRFAILALALAIIITTFACNSVCAFAQDNSQTGVESLPYLNSIEFKNGTLDTPFTTEVTDYTMTLQDNSLTPTLSSYSIGGDANIFVTYSYNETNHQTGIVATLEYESGSTIYRFTYSNPAKYEVNTENHLSTIFCTYGELRPSMSDKKSQYTLYIPSDLTDIKLTPVTKDVNAYASSVHMILTETQEPEISVPVTASDGSSKTYKINIKRVDKTTAQVIEEMKQTGYKSFVPEEKFYENPTFTTASIAVVGGILLLILFFVLTRRITVDVYDKDEKPFYKQK